MQRALLDTVLAGAGYPGIAKTLHAELGNPVAILGEGHVCLITDATDRDLLEVAISQAAMACCLVESQQQAAIRARAQVCEEVLWDLLEGPADQRARPAAVPPPWASGCRLRCGWCTPG